MQFRLTQVKNAGCSPIAQPFRRRNALHFRYGSLAIVVQQLGTTPITQWFIATAIYAAICKQPHCGNANRRTNYCTEHGKGLNWECLYFRREPNYLVSLRRHEAGGSQGKLGAMLA